MKVRAVGTVTKKNGPSDEWNVKFPFIEVEANHTIWVSYYESRILHKSHPERLSGTTPSLDASMHLKTRNERRKLHCESQLTSRQTTHASVVYSVRRH
eukprot:g39126.t1